MKRKVSHRPSCLDMCVRANYYEFKGVEPSDPVTPELQAIFDEGNKIHDELDLELKKKYNTVLTEVPFKHRMEGLEFLFSGRADNIIIDDGCYEGVEIKSINPWGFKQALRGIIKPAYLLQAKLYQHVFGVPFRLLFYNKEANEDGTHDLHSVYMPDDVSETIEKIKESCKTVEHHVINDILPERPFKAAVKNGEIKAQFTKDKVTYKTDVACKNCKYKSMCWKVTLEKEGCYNGEEEV